MSIISFTCDKNYIYILIYYILEIGGAILKNIEEKNEEKEIIYHIKSKYTQIILLILADFLFLPFIIYTKCSLKKSNQNINNSKSEIKLIYNNPFNSLTQKSKKIISYSFLISVLDLISRSVYFMFFLFKINEKYEEDKKSLIEILPKRYYMDYILALDIIFRYLFSKIILKTKVYNHHKVSIFISIIGFILFIINDILDFFSEDFNTNILIYMLIVSLRAILFPLEDTINQILLSKYFLLPHYLLVIRGIIEFVVFSLITIILIILKIELFEAKIIFTFYNLIYLISYSIKAFCLMKIIYIFNS